MPQVYENVTTKIRENFNIGEGPLTWENRVADGSIYPLAFLKTFPKEWKAIRFQDDQSPQSDSMEPLMLIVIDEYGRLRAKLFKIEAKISGRETAIMVLPSRRMQLLINGSVLSHEANRAHVVALNIRDSLVPDSVDKETFGLPYASLKNLAAVSRAMDRLYPQWRDPSAHWENSEPVSFVEKIDRWEFEVDATTEMATLFQSHSIHDGRVRVSLPYLVWNGYYSFLWGEYYTPRNSPFLSAYSKMGFELIGPNTKDPELYDVILPPGWRTASHTELAFLNVIDDRNRVRATAGLGNVELTYHPLVLEFFDLSQQQKGREVSYSLSANGVVLAVISAKARSEDYIRLRDLSWSLKRRVITWVFEHFTPEGRSLGGSIPNLGILSMMSQVKGTDYYWNLSQEELFQRAGVSTGPDGNVIPVKLSL